MAKAVNHKVGAQDETVEGRDEEFWKTFQISFYPEWSIHALLELFTEDDGTLLDGIQPRIQQ